MRDEWAVISIEPKDNSFDGVSFASSDSIVFYNTFKEAFDFFKSLNGTKSHLIIKKDNLKILELAPIFFKCRKN